MTTQSTAEPIDVKHKAQQMLDRLMPWGISFLLHLSIGLLVLFVLVVMPEVVEPDAPIEPMQLREIQKHVGLASSAAIAPDVSPVAVNIPPTPTSPAMPDPLNVLGARMQVALPRASKSLPRGLTTRVRGKFFGTSIGEGEGDDSSGGDSSVVFVIDASGSMVEKFESVQRELMMAVGQLEPEARFNVIYFQNDAAIFALPRSLVVATAENKARLADRLEARSRFILPRGSSNPLPALKAALSLGADQIIVLSDNITGSGKYQIELEHLLAEVRTAQQRRGNRRAEIHAVQFLRPDPQEALRRLALENQGTYRFVGADVMD